jgi:pantetheine-phosphate adenylyltransferase
MLRYAIYPGSFDPLTNGHVAIIQRGLKLFDRLVVAVANNPQKTPLFSVEERKELVDEAFGHDPRIEIDSFNALLTDYARKKGISTILRGLRAVSDFDYEFQIANMNLQLMPEIETVFVMTGEDYFFVSARLVREVATFGGDVSSLVPKNVEEALKKKLRR